MSVWARAHRRIRRAARPRLVFLHIPKTAGTTLVGVIEREYGPGLLRVYEGGFGISRDELRGLSRGQRRAARAVVGHLTFGAADVFPGRSVYATLLRDPVDRVVSHFGYVLGQPSLIELHDAAGPDVSLEQHVARSPLRHLINNAQTRQLGGDWSEPEREPGPRELDRAIERFDDFAAFGIQERFEESLLQIARALGWRLPAYETVNVTPTPIASEEVDDHSRAAIEEHNALDRALYDHARTRFEQVLARNPIPATDLEALRASSSS